MNRHEEIQAVRDYLERALGTCGHRIAPGLDDDAFAGRLRRRLMTFTGGDEPIGFHYASSKNPAGDYIVTLTWQGDESNGAPPMEPNEFSASGANEALAFFRAAEKVLRNRGYIRMLFLRPRPL
jgi:hypothetical protein